MIMGFAVEDGSGDEFEKEEDEVEIDDDIDEEDDDVDGNDIQQEGGENDINVNDPLPHDSLMLKPTMKLQFLSTFQVKSSLLILN